MKQTDYFHKGFLTNFNLQKRIPIITYFVFFYQNAITETKQVEPLTLLVSTKSARLLPDNSLDAFNGFYCTWKPVKFRWKHFGYSSHICYGKRFCNDFFLNHNTIALVRNRLKLLSCVVIETALDGMKRINYLNSLLSTRKTYHLTSSRTVLNAMIAMHVHKQLWLIILIWGIREKVNTGELFSLL